MSFQVSQQGSMWSVSVQQADATKSRCYGINKEPALIFFLFLTPYEFNEISI